MTHFTVTGLAVIDVRSYFELNVDLQRDFQHRPVHSANGPQLCDGPISILYCVAVQ
jgi:hypothetical protein